MTDDRYPLPAIDEGEVQRAIRFARSGLIYVVLEGSVNRTDVIHSVLAFFDRPCDLPPEGSEEEAHFGSDLLDVLENAAHDQSLGKVAFGSMPDDPACWAFWCTERDTLTDEDGTPLP